LKGIAEEVADTPPVGCTVTCVAVTIAPLVHPSTRTGSPLAMALAEAELVPFWYVVEDASSTVTVWPVAVVTLKVDLDVLATVPTTPPGAGPDRALDAPPAAPPPGKPLPPGMGCPADAEGDPAVAEVDVPVAEGEDEAQPAESPITVHSSAAAPSRRPLVFDSDRGTAPPELPATDGPDVVLVSWGLVWS
jgi:hypothetical protein